VCVCEGVCVRARARVHAGKSKQLLVSEELSCEETVYNMLMRICEGKADAGAMIFLGVMNSSQLSGP